MLEVVSSDVPDPCDPVQSEITNLDVKLTWNEPSDNFAEVEYYTVKVLESNLVDFTEETLYCDGTNEQVVQQKSCLIPLSLLHEEPWALQFDSLVAATVTACNRNGCGAASVPNAEGARTQTVPLQPASPVEAQLTNENQVHISWAVQTSHEETGGTDILSYNLRWDKGSNGLTWYHAIGFTQDELIAEYVVSDGVLPGNLYFFQVRSKNKWGWSEWSAVAQVKASTWPDVVEEPSTSVDLQSGSVVISWVEPYFHSSEITHYSIEINDQNDQQWKASA